MAHPCFPPPPPRHGSCIEAAQTLPCIPFKYLPTVQVALKHLWVCQFSFLKKYLWKKHLQLPLSINCLARIGKVKLTSNWQYLFGNIKTSLRKFAERHFTRKFECFLFWRNDMHSFPDYYVLLWLSVHASHQLSATPHPPPLFINFYRQ